MMKSKGFKIAALVVAAMLIALVSFIGGAKVGAHRALFSCRWGENYERNFMGGRPPMNGHQDFFGPMMRGFLVVIFVTPMVWPAQSFPWRRIK